MELRIAPYNRKVVGHSTASCVEPIVLGRAGMLIFDSSEIANIGQDLRTPADDRRLINPFHIIVSKSVRVSIL